ncbi:hypothetical protein [Parasphingorhabdus halotolerans]|uniref:Uncharacterized protein n=1 Tax=Parasphingorhabdus halotolerans TaxID=2725558 RepID=A0A6H2DQU1_9SPHN|nr:hypothetical protein [Parasphingorhabdus halotolerans]QJB70325.1 hypothetical protein HF685_14465 [Parasphingorhabdus halotolerans]
MAAFFLTPGNASAELSSDPLSNVIYLSAEQMIVNANKLVAVDADGCLKNDRADEIIVCGAFDANRRHRLPFPELIERGQRISEPIPQGDAQYVNTGRCYIDASERKCFKGLHIVSVGFGGAGGGVSGPAGRLWKVIDPGVPDEDYVKRAQISKVKSTE